MFPGLDVSRVATIATLASGGVALRPSEAISQEALAALSRPPIRVPFEFEQLQFDIPQLLGEDDRDDVRMPGQTVGVVPVLSDLEQHECAALLATRGIGRLVVGAPGRIVRLPLSWRMLDRDIIFRSSRDGLLSAIASGVAVTFEVETADVALREGLSLVASGILRRVSLPGELAQLAMLRFAPWVGSARPEYFRLEVSAINGHRINIFRV